MRLNTVMILSQFDDKLKVGSQEPATAPQMPRKAQLTRKFEADTPTEESASWHNRVLRLREEAVPTIWHGWP